MAGTPVTVRLGYDAIDSEIEELRVGLNALIDAMETFRAAMAAANGGNIAMAATTLSKVLSIQERLNNSTTPTAPLAIAVNGGDAQSGTVGTALATPLTVLVTRSGVAVPGAIVTWQTSDDGALAGGESSTNASGIASMTYTLGILASGKSVTASVTGGASVTFTATATAGAATTVAAATATDQSAATSSAVAAPPGVRVTDDFGNGKSGVTVTFAVTVGGGSRSPATVDTDADGLATLTSWTLGASAGLNTLTATAAGLTGSPVTFNANGVATLPTQIVVQSGGSQTGIVAGSASAAITFRVKDGSNNPVQGVTVNFTADGGILSVASAVTNASGDAAVTLTTSALAATYTVTAGFLDNSGITVQVSTTVTSTFGTATKLRIVTQPASNGSSGTALPGQPVIEVTDANNNRVTSSTASITTSVASGNATITAGGTKACVSGLATFTALTMNDADGGANTIQFDSAGLTGVTSTGVTLTPPVPDRLAVFTQPTSTQLGLILTPAPAVNVQDSSNISVPGATNAVTVSLGDNGEGATLSGTLTVNAVDGTATFSDLVVSVVAGSFTLVFTSSGLTGTTSAAFTVSAASATYPNLPAGYTLLAQTPCSTVPTTSYAQIAGSTGYYIKESGAITAQSDATGPLSPPTVWRTRYNTTQAQGAAPVNVGIWGNSNYSAPTQYSGLYLSFRIKIGTTSGFLNHPAGTKMGFIGYANTPSTSRNQLYFLWKGVGGTSATNMTASTFRLTQQNVVSGGPTSDHDCTGGNLITTGVWHHIELLLGINSSANATDGTMQVFVNGTRRLNVPDMVYKFTGNTRGFQWYAWNPTWGGNVNGVTHAGSTDDILFDDITIYGLL